MQHFSWSPSSTNLMIIQSNCGHTINSSTPKMWLWEELRDMQWNCRELLGNICCEGTEKRQKVWKIIYFENFLRIASWFLGVWIMTWSWRSSQEFLEGSLTQSLLALMLGSRKDLPAVYRDAGELQSQKSHPLGHLFIPRTLTYFSFSSWCSHNASFKFDANMWTIQLLFEDCEELRWEGKVWKLGFHRGEDVLVPHTRVCRCYWTFWQQVHLLCFLPTKVYHLPT